MAVVPAALFLIGAAAAQTVPAPDWRRIGNGGIDVPLASPGSGRVERVWFSPDGSRLYARTAYGQVFETSDRENWQPSEAAPPPSEEFGVLPEGAAGMCRNPLDPNQLYAYGANLLRSDDGGVSWRNLTAYRNASIIGSGMRDAAVSPAGGEEVVVANDVGLWRSADGGVSWAGMNESLPNLPVMRFSGVPQSTRGVRIVTDGYGVVEWAPGEKRAWRPVGPDIGEAERRVASAAIGSEVATTAGAGDYRYAGDADGRIWVSLDGGSTWSSPAPGDRGAVRAIWVDQDEPRVALAALAGPAGPRVLRTVNGGQFWDDLTADLPDGVAAHGVTGDRAAGVIYVATDQGVFFAAADLNAPAPARPWTRLEGLPAARALDVRLDPGGNQLFVALEGYGVYAAMAPHRYRSPRLVNAADFSSRPAAPGSLLSLLGARVTAAEAANTAFPVLAATDAESQIQVPFNVNGRVSLSLDTSAGALQVPLPVRPVSPAIFVDRDGTPLVLDADTGVLLDGSNPAHSNYRLVVLATGLGAVRPEWPAGRPAPAQNPPEVVAPVRAFLDRSPVDVTRAVLAPGYIGLYLIEIQLPAIVNSGSSELYIEAGGEESNRVSIVIEP
ncbi:MAG: hypothetical protein ACM3ZB_01040 [bacterium]